MRKVVFYFMFLFPFISFGQSESIEVLGKELTNALALNDSALFKSLIVPKDSLQAYFANDSSVSSEIKQMQMEYLNNSYESQMVAMFMLNFKLLQHKVELFNLNFNEVKFEELFIPTPEQKPLHVVHGSIDHTTFRHLYFYPIKYNRRYYLVNPMLEIRDSKLDF